MSGEMQERGNKRAPRRGRKRHWRHLETRIVRGDEARRQGQLTRLMSSLFPRLSPLSDPASSHPLAASFLLTLFSYLNHPPSYPPAITLRSSCAIPLLLLAGSESDSQLLHCPVTPLLFLSPFASNLIVTHELRICSVFNKLTSALLCLACSD